MRALRVWLLAVVLGAGPSGLFAVASFAQVPSVPVPGSDVVGDFTALAAANTSMQAAVGHLQGSLQRLLMEVDAGKTSAAAKDAYWASYVAGLKPAVAAPK